MPLVPYRCLGCDHAWDELVRNITEQPEECPSCKAKEFKRELSTPGGYSIRGNNSGSTRPRHAGSFKRNK